MPHAAVATLVEMICGTATRRAMSIRAALETMSRDREFLIHLSQGVFFEPPFLSLSCLGFF